MEYIREWAIALCISAVASGIMVFLIPDGKLKKTAEIVVSLFLLITLVSIFSGKYDFNDNLKSNFSLKSENYSVEFDDYLIGQSKKTVEAMINSELTDVCDENFSVETNWHINGDNVCMDSVKIVINAVDRSKINIVKNKVSALTGVIPEVNFK